MTDFRIERDDASAAFFDAARQGRLVIKRCVACGRLYPPAQERFDDPAPFTLWLPSDWFVWDSIRAGHLPLWDRLQGGGYSPLVTFTRRLW